MTRQQILEAAITCVTKDRNATHGEPEDNFKVIARLWNSYLVSNQHEAVLTSLDVAVMMILMKLSRVITSPQHIDHWIDIAGYAACGGEIAIKNTEL